jgi:hypothetical protein
MTVSRRLLSNTALHDIEIVIIVERCINVIVVYQSGVGDVKLKLKTN